MNKGIWIEDGYRLKCPVCGYSSCGTDDEGEPIPDKIGFMWGRSRK